ncbi:hypothetical protein ACO0QE_003266 [Hanseniaspora vineae]
MSTNFDSALAMKRSMSSTSYNDVYNQGPLQPSASCFSSLNAYGNSSSNNNDQNNHITYNNSNAVQAQSGIATFGAQSSQISQTFAPPQSTTISSSTNVFKKRKRARDQTLDEISGTDIFVSHGNVPPSSRTIFPNPQVLQADPFHGLTSDNQDPMHVSPSSNYDTEEHMDMSPSPPSSNYPSNTPSVFSYGPNHNQYADYNSVEFVEDYMAEGYDLKQTPVMHNSLETDTDSAQQQSNNKKSHTNPAVTGYKSNNIHEEMQFDALIPSASDYRTVNSSYSASLDDITGAQYSLYDDVDS